MQRLCRALAALFFVGLALAGCAGAPKPPTSINAARLIHLVHPESGEKVRTTYWRDGAYVQQALLDISTLFRDRRTQEVRPINPELVDYIHDLRENVGMAPDTPVHLLSGFRSKESNVHLAKSNRNVAENSFHVRGQAADLRFPGVAPDRVAAMAASMQRGGYAVYPGTGHVHVDIGPVRTWRVRY